MKRFTVKDFILSTSPCFGCSARLPFNMGITDFSEDKRIDTSAHKQMVITGEHSTIALRTSYNNSLSLVIYHKTNRFQVNDLKGFELFLKTHRVFINSYCKKCHSRIDTHYLEFNMTRGFVKPFGISGEDITVSDETTNYMIHSSALDGTSTIIVMKRKMDVTSLPVRLEVPILPLSKFKNKEQLIEKIKLYLLFS